MMPATGKGAPIAARILLILAAGLLVTGHARAGSPEGKGAGELLIMKKEWLVLNSKALAAGDSRLKRALDRLVKRAEKALQAGPFSVTQKKRKPPSGDRHDYMSVGPYWWPDPKKKDGLPYVRRDGQVNPESRTDSDSPRMSRMCSAVRTLALAWFFAGEDRYARRAALLLRTWFLDPGTRMNPHLEYGQAIPGRVEGRGVGIIDTHGLISVVDSAQLLRASKSWTAADHRGLRKWFDAYLKWLLESGHGRDESRAHNNHGAWYDAQVACFALFAGRKQTARKVLAAAGRKRIAGRIDSRGRQKHELARTRSFDYSCFNLAACFTLARLGESVGVDLWNFGSGKKPALRAALDYLAPHADPAEKWRHKQITEPRREALPPLLHQGLLVYGDPGYARAIAKIPAGTRRRGFAELIYPVPKEKKATRASGVRKHK